MDSLAGLPHTLVLFESARRAPALLEELAERLGPRLGFVAREMTKLHEEYQSGTIPELARWARDKALKGELTLVIAGSADPSRRKRAQHDQGPDLLTRFRKLTREGFSRREAVKTLARERGLESRYIYRELLRLESDEPKPSE